MGEGKSITCDPPPYSPLVSLSTFIQEIDELSLTCKPIDIAIMSYAVPRIPPLSTLSTKAHSRSGSIPADQSPRSPASPYDPLSSALSTAQARYTIANAQSLKAHNEACHDFPGGNTRTVLHSSPFPITFGEQPYSTGRAFINIHLVRGKGCELTSLDGDVYVDFLGEFTAGIYGHSNELIASVVSEAMKKGWNYGGPNPYERELARKVRDSCCLEHAASSPLSFPQR